jgi:surface carbohydrate biosynthesis protein (TIGR04326 family)
MNQASPFNVLLWDSDAIPPLTNDYVVLWNGFTDPDLIQSSISIPDYIEEHSDRLRSRFLSFVHDVGNSQSGGETILEHLQLRPTFSYWWLTLFASKRWHPNSHVNEAVKIIALEEILAGLKYREIFVQSENAYLHSQIGHLLHASPEIRGRKASISSLKFKPLRITRHIFRACATLVRQIIVLRDVVPMETEPVESDILIFDHLVRFDQNAARNGEFTSQYWNSLQPLLQERAQKITWIHQFVKTNDQQSPNDAQAILSTINSRSQQKHFQLECRLSQSVVMQCLRDYCKLLRAGFKTRHIADCFSLNGSKLNLWSLFQDEWYESLIGSTAMRHLLILATTEASLSQVPHCKTGIYLMENQPWEIALLHSWSAAGHGRIIGLVNAPIRFWDVRYFVDQRSLSPFGNDHMHFQPQPPEIFVNGPLSRKLLEDSGIKPHQIGDVEPLMYQYLQNDTSPKFVQGDDILVLGDFFTHLTKRIISLVVESQQLSGDLRNVLFKPHPLNRDPLSHVLGANFTLTNAPLSELFEMCSIVVAPSASTGALEAYCANKSVVSILEPSTLNYTPLMGVEGAMFVKNSQDLANFLSKTPMIVSSNRQSLFFLDSQLSRWTDILGRSGLQN